MKIKVTQEHIDLGERKLCSECPVALAVIEATGIACEVEPDEIRFKGRYFQLPPAACRFISEFDCGAPVQPFEFELPIP